MLRSADPRLARDLSIGKFLVAFGIFRDVVCSRFPHRRQELDLYMALIGDLNLKKTCFTSTTRSFRARLCWLCWSGAPRPYLAARVEAWGILLLFVCWCRFSRGSPSPSLALAGLVLPVERPTWTFVATRCMLLPGGLSVTISMRVCGPMVIIISLMFAAAVRKPVRAALSEGVVVVRTKGRAPILSNKCFCTVLQNFVQSRFRVR